MSNKIAVSESQNKLVDICHKSLRLRGVDNNPKYKKRIKWELEEISSKNKADYFLNLYASRTRYPENQNNLLVCWLLGIVKDCDIDKDPNCEYGEYPDIDVDYLPEVQEYLKNTWAGQTFGAEYVCNIGNYTTFGIKSALLDMARVHGKDKDVIQAITKGLDAKDDEGKTLTWDAAMRLYPELKKYCEENPDVADATRRLINRNRGMGVHAGGLIIANQPLSDLVPLVKRKDNPQASAWAEGLNGQDLSPVGLVKFDLLVISNLLQIARCCEMVKNRHNLEGICNRPGEPDWTDVPKWRNDPKSLAMANSGDLKCIFQFDSEGMRGLVRAGGVDRFEDLVAYTALFRPGPLGMKMQERYVERKRGREKYGLHPLVRPILEKTYGVLCYQEQVMRMLNVVGEIPLKDCELVRKAISKKKIEGFIKYKEMFVINGQRNLSVSEQEINHLWDQIEAFAEYGFNLSHAVAYTYISAWLLYLKAHYPHEFYTAVLSCEDKSEKIKEYKMEAKVHGIEMHRLDINKSNINFELKGDVIFYGMSNIKGIGDAPAKRIVDNQPYSSFDDFLARFGTDASVLKPLIGLRCFLDRDPITLWKFADYYKECFKKIEDKKKRYESAMIRYEEEFKELLPLEVRTLAEISKGSAGNPFDAGGWKLSYDKDEDVEVRKEVLCEKNDPGAVERIVVEDYEVEGVIIQKDVLKYFRLGNVKKKWNRWKELRKLWQRRAKSIERYHNLEKDNLPKLASFDPNSWEIDNDLLKEFRNLVACEEKYYGFAWVHELEKSPDYKGNRTFDVLRNSHDESGPVEVKIKKITRQESKKGNIYYQILAEDVTGHQANINVFVDDWFRWHKEIGWIQPTWDFLEQTPKLSALEIKQKMADLEKSGKIVYGNLLSMRLNPPSNGFTTFTLESNQIGKWRGGRKKFENKDEDFRVAVMKKGNKEEEKILTDEEALKIFDNCIME